MLSIDDYPHTWERIVNQENILGAGNEKRTDLLLFSMQGFIIQLESRGHSNAHTVIGRAL